MGTEILKGFPQKFFAIRWRKRKSTADTHDLLQIERSVIEEIRNTIGSMPAEQGGMLGGSRKDGVVRHFYFDRAAVRTNGSYSPDVETINKLLRETWNPNGIDLLGFVHSHPGRLKHPSGGDLEYAGKILAAIPELTCLYLPIVTTEPKSGHFGVFPYGAVRAGNGARWAELKLTVIDSAETKANAALDVFRRVRNAYDLRRLSRSRVIYVGTGGAASFIEDMTRSGIGEHVLIDPDVVAESNIATQQVYRKDMGRPKVDCIADRIRDINANAKVIALQQSLDAISDADFERLAFDPLARCKPEAVLLCGLTDSFDAQARVNRLALHFGIPSLCAHVYLEGRGEEVTFTFPGVTPACHRCVLRSRYSAYLEHGYRNTVTSDGTPIFATTRLNALKGFIAMAMLHHGTDHPRWGSLLSRIGNRNLVLIRTDPDIASTVNISLFEKVFHGAAREYLVFDETIWLPQTPDCPENGYPYCPDCGGTGDLRNAIGTFDTRKMRILGAQRS